MDAYHSGVDAAAFHAGDDEGWKEFALECAEVGAWRSFPQSGRFEVAGAFRKIHGLADDAPINLDIAHSMIHPDDRERALEDCKRMAGRRETFSTEFRIRRGDGALRWMHVQGRWVAGPPGVGEYLVGVTRDETERKNTQEALHYSRNRLQEAKDIAGLGFWEFDAAAQKIIWCERMCAIVGRDPALGAPTFLEFRAIVHPDDRPLFDTLVERATTMCEDYEVDWRLRHADGHFRWVRTRARAYHDEAGRCRRLVGTDLDITQIKLAEESLRQSLIQRETLVTESHHRIKNSIASVAALLQIQARSQSLEQARTALLDAEQRVQTVGRIHEALYKSASFTSVDFGAHLRVLMEDVARSVATRNGIPPVLHLDCPDGIELTADSATPLSQVVVELVMNAVKHVGAVRDDVVIRIAFQPGDPMRLVVADNGLGLPAQPDKSKGLGLRLVKLLSQQLGGAATFENGPTGLVATIAFPPPIDAARGSGSGAHGLGR
ncbi:sensor histidine kinase [Azospirillum sp. sgz302134]